MTTRHRRTDDHPNLSDILAIGILRIAKLRRKHLIRPSAEVDFYENFFHEADHRLYSHDPRTTVRRRTITAFLARHVSRGSTIVDVGCGLGDVLAGIDATHKRIGVEAAASNARAVVDRSGAAISVVRGSATQLPFRAEGIDVCLCLEVLEHLEQDALAVREMHRVVRPGGWAIVAVPYTYYWNAYYELAGHYRHYTRMTVRELLEGAGFRVEHYLPNYPTWHQAFTRRYACARVVHTVLGRMLKQRTVYDLRVPWADHTIMEGIERRLEDTRLRDGERDYAHAETSTFVAGRRA